MVGRPHLPRDQPDDIEGMLPIVAPLIVRSDDVVRRSNDLGQVDMLRVVEDSLEWANGRQNDLL
jgi:hypothetical protein